MAPLAPFATRIAGGAWDVRALSNDELAVLGEEIVIFDRALTIKDRIGLGAATLARRLLPLEDGRFLAHAPTFTQLFVGVRGGVLELASENYFDTVIATRSGFVATGYKNVLVEVERERRLLDLPADKGVARLEDGAVVASSTGITWLDAKGEVRSRQDHDVVAQPLALGRDLLLSTKESVVVLREGEERARIPVRVGATPLVPFGNGVLQADAESISFWVIEGAPRLVWSFTRDTTALTAPLVVGDRIVIGASEGPSVWIVDRDGSVMASLDLDDTLWAAQPLGSGVVLQASSGNRLVWWRPDAEGELLEHDGTPGLLAPTPDGIVSTDGDMLYVWRAEEQGPEPPTIATRIPFDVNVVIDGMLHTVERPGRFALRARDLRGQARAIAPDAKFRLATTADEAKGILARLLARDTTGPLPEVPWTDINVHRELAMLPLEDTVVLQTRALFAPTTLARDMHLRAWLARDAFFRELAIALGSSRRALTAGVRKGEFPLVAPQRIEGFEYLGSFTTAGTLVVSDPCYLGRSKGAYPLSFTIEARGGRWHAYVRPDARDEERTAELVVVHESGFDVFAAELFGNVGVDGGQAGVFDRAVARPKEDEPPMEEGIIGGLGALASSGLGDGLYPAFKGSKAGEVAKIRIHFLIGADEPEIDLTVARSGGASTAEGPRPYRATETFAVGEKIQHKKFGHGTVVRDLSQGKIEVLFADGPRVLMHGIA